MSQVPTVRGPVGSAELGPTYMHEHIFVLTADVQQNYPEEWGSEETRVADAVGKLQGARRPGVGTHRRPTVIGLGRYIPRIQRVAEQVPELNIVVATGVYTYDDVPFFFHYRGPGPDAALGTEVPDPMVDMFVARHHRRDHRHRRARPACSSAPSTATGMTAAWSGSCGPWPGPTARPARRSRCTPIRARPASR